MLAPSIMIVQGGAVVESIRKHATALETALLSAKCQYGRMARMFGVREDDAAALLEGAGVLRRLDELQSFVSLCREQLAQSIASPFGFEAPPCHNCGSKTGDGCGECSAEFCSREMVKDQQWTADEILRREG